MPEALEKMRGMGDVLVGRMGYDNDFEHSSAAEILDRISTSLPELQAQAAASDFGRINILPPPVWYPVNWNYFIQTIFRNKMFRENGVVDRGKARWLFPHAYIVTYWSASWK